ncbi:MAG: hypothetical protein JJE23_05360 [Thermoleophilia bacterium]|nr:hypothetical protein [Thermoleophilia bacterium]
MSRSRLRGPGEIAEDEAGPALARTYSRLREMLGVGFVPTLYRMLGVHESYLAAAADSIEGLIEGGGGEAFAVGARGLAGRAAADFPAASIQLGREADPINAMFERYNRANPRNLLVARALLPAGPDDAGGVMGPRENGPTSFADQEAVLVDVEAAHGGFVRPGLWRELAEFPEVLTEAWLAVSPLGDVPAFQDARASILSAATSAAADVDPPDPRELGLGGEAVRSIEATLSWFTRGISAMIIEIEYLRRITHGPNDPSLGKERTHEG